MLLYHFAFVVQLHLTLCNPMDCLHTRLLCPSPSPETCSVIIESVMPSNHLILCRPHFALILYYEIKLLLLSVLKQITGIMSFHYTNLSVYLLRNIVFPFIITVITPNKNYIHCFASFIIQFIFPQLSKKIFVVICCRLGSKRVYTLCLFAGGLMFLNAEHAPLFWGVGASSCAEVRFC